MQRSPADSFSASQEIPRILCNRKVHYRIHISPPLAPTMRQINPAHTLPNNSFKTQFNIKKCIANLLHWLQYRAHSHNLRPYSEVTFRPHKGHTELQVTASLTN
jgi:hypothetical protein